ncbi:MAG: right-handed parallel beta-helix repeat-containing protein [Clostridia bacterium]|nr:right-handed parallel beta-helix repeat-containing protein [Clostridia bacterium]
MRTRKIIALCVAFALLVACFAGCTPKVVTAEEVYNVLEHGVKADGKTDVSGVLYDLIEEVARTGGTLVFPKGTYYVKNDAVTFSAKVGVVMLEGAKFKIHEDSAVKVQGGSFVAPKEQIFTGEGTVGGFINVPNVYPEWFGAVVNDGKDDSEAIAAALRANGKVTFSEGEYNIEKSVDLSHIPNSIVDIFGAGADKTKITIANNIIGFDGHSDGKTISIFNAHGISFCEKDNLKTSTAIKLGRPWMSARNCHFEGLKIGTWFDYAGFCQFEDNTAKACEVVYEISEYSMFLYFNRCEAIESGTLIKAVVGPSGGVSNGILIQNCKSTDAYAEDIYITENQAVWIANCEFIGGSGGLASIYFKSHIDSGVENCIISSKKGTDRAGISFDTVHYSSIENNVISDCSEAITAKNGGALTITENTVSGSSKNDIVVRSQYNTFIARNQLKSSVANGIIGEKNNRKITVVENMFASAEYDIASKFPAINGIITKDNVFNYNFD